MLLTVVGLALAPPLAGGPRPPAAAAATGATLSFPNTTCSGSGTASVKFAWTPIPGASEQWLDLTLLDNGFAPGTFIGAGALKPSVSEFTWTGIQGERAHLWRVNALTANGWVTSTVGAFVPCGGPALLNPPVSCTGAASATVKFRWAPPSSPGVAQWLDLGGDPSFAEGTFVGIGPLKPSDSEFVWPAVQANVRWLFRVNSQTVDGWRTSEVGSFVADCTTSSELYGSADRLLIPRLGIDAPVNVRDVGLNGVLGNPAGPTDVVRYNFAIFPGLGGYPGDGGNTTIAGHVDYYSYGLAVFAPLRYVQVGDVVEYRRGDGVTVTYSVQWYADYAPSDDWGSLVATTAEDSLTLVTCNGVFNSSAREYSHRRVVRAVRVS